MATLAPIWKRAVCTPGLEQDFRLEDFRKGLGCSEIHVLHYQR